MFRATTLLLAVCLLFGLVGTSAAQWDGQQRSWRVGVLLGYASAKHDDLDDTIDSSRTDFEALIDSLQAAHVTVTSYEFNSGHMTGGLAFGVRAEYALSESFLVGIDAGLLTGNGDFDHSYDYEDEQGSKTTSVATRYEVTGILTSVRGTYLIRPSAVPFALRLGGGVGFVRGNLHETTEGFNLVDKKARDTERFNTGVDASGYGMAYEAFAGVEYMMTDRVWAAADVGYRFARVKQLSVDTVDALPHVTEGETLYWNDQTGFSTEEGTELGLNFSGVYFTLAIGATF